MKHPSILLFLAVFPFSACGRDDSIKTYRLAKDAPSAPSADAPLAGLAAGDPHAMPMVPGMGPAASASDVTWKVPKGWQTQAPSAMRVGSFLIPGPDGRPADVSVIPLGGDAGGDLANINRWRDQIDLPPLSEKDLASALHSRSLGGHTFRVIDFVSDKALIGGRDKKRVVAGILPHGGQTWFFKMAGEDRWVEASKDDFFAFLSSVRFKNAAR